MILHIDIRHFDDRKSKIDTIIIHSCFAPDAQDPFCPQESISLFNQCKVSAHYLISRDGNILNLVPEENRAWHAGVSKLPFPDDPREAVNDFSIGIELIGENDFTEAQYLSLIDLINKIKTRHDIKYILGHNHIAPDRKVDPGENFDWARLKKIFNDCFFR